MERSRELREIITLRQPRRRHITNLCTYSCRNGIDSLRIFFEASECFSKRSNSMVDVDDADVSMNATKGSTPNNFQTADKHFFFFAVCEHLVWVSSSSVLHRRWTQTSVSLVKSRELLHYVYCTKASLPVPVEFEVTMGYESSPSQPRISSVFAR